MNEVFTKNFHSGLRSVKSGERDIYMLGEWRPSNPHCLVGVHFGLLCYPTDNLEIYICVSRSPSLKADDNFLILKQDYLFYAQRDSYEKCIGIKDLLDWQMLPPNNGFTVSREAPVYIKVAVASLENPAEYDAWVNVYYEIR